MDQSGLFRLGIFAAILAVMALWEAVAPYRPREAVRRSMRWLTNFGLLLLSAVPCTFHHRGCDDCRRHLGAGQWLGDK